VPAPDNAGGNNPQPKQKAPLDAEGLFNSIQQSVTQGRTTDAEVIGIQAKNYPYRDVPQEGGILIGLDTAFEKFGGNKLIVKSIRPVFLTKNGERLGAWVGKDKGEPPNPNITRAKNGYVVVGMNIRAAIFIEGISLRCAKLENGRLNLNDNYQTPWVGDSGKAGDSKMIGGPGVLAVGIHGFRGITHEPCAIGLVTAPLPN
jgi:hypothetical protein